jgi:hypothetical protein
MKQAYWMKKRNVMRPTIDFFPAASMRRSSPSGTPAGAGLTPRQGPQGEDTCAARKGSTIFAGPGSPRHLPLF